LTLVIQQKVTVTLPPMLLKVATVLLGNQLCAIN